MLYNDCRIYEVIFIFFFVFIYLIILLRLFFSFVVYHNRKT